MSRLSDLATDNFRKIRGTEKIGKYGIEFYVTLNDESIGKPYPISIKDSIIRIGEENSPGWSIPSRHAVIGVYIGMKRIYAIQPATEMTFATPTTKGRYTLYAAATGILDMYGDAGDDEPALASGISVVAMCISDKNNTLRLNTRLGKQFNDLSNLIESH
jgi:hypothetical protein